MDYSYKKQKTILLFSWASAVLFFFFGALVISEQRKAPPPENSLVIDNESYSENTDVPISEEISGSSFTETTEDIPTNSETGDIPNNTETESENESLSTDAPQTTTAPPVDTTPPVITPPSPPPKYESPDYSNFDAVLKESADAGKEYLDKMVFLGDSRTYGLGYYGVVSKKQIWTPSNGTLTLSLVNSVLIVYPETGESITVKDAVARKKPEILVISLGINGISFMNERSFKGTFDVLINNIKAVSPDTKIILQAMYPTAPSYRNWYSINNTKILRGNQWMLESAQSNGVYFLDAYNILADENGNMSANYHNGDWLHPNALGYQMIVQYIKTHPILPPAPVQEPQDSPVTTINDVLQTPPQSETSESDETTSETTGTI